MVMGHCNSANGMTKEGVADNRYINKNIKNEQRIWMTNSKDDVQTKRENTRKEDLESKVNKSARHTSESEILVMSF